jgi:hypothetical protein
MREDDLERIRDYCDRVYAEAAARGIVLRRSSFADEFCEFLGQQEQTHGVSSIHNPVHSDIRPREFEWLLGEIDGVGVCCHAIRLIETEDLIQDILTGRLYADAVPAERWQDPGIYPGAREIKIAGRVAFAGGLWVAPAHRGGGLPALIRKMLRLTTLGRFRWTDYVSTFQNTPNRRAWSMDDSGNTRMFPLSRGHYVPYGSELDVIMATVTAEETLEMLRDGRFR